MEVRVLFGASSKALHSRGFRRFGTRVSGGVNFSGNALWQMGHDVPPFVPPSRRTPPDEHPLSTRAATGSSCGGSRTAAAGPSVRLGGRRDRVRRLAAQARPAALRSPRRAPRPPATGSTRTRRSAGIRYRFVFRQSDGTLSSRRGFTSRRAAATARRRLVESIDAARDQGRARAFETFWLRLLEEKRPYLTRARPRTSRRTAASGCSRSSAPRRSRASTSSGPRWMARCRPRRCAASWRRRPSTTRAPASRSRSTRPSAADC